MDRVAISLIIVIGISIVKIGVPCVSIIVLSTGPTL